MINDDPPNGPSSPIWYPITMNTIIDRSCLSYWYPKIRGVVRTPQTFFVKISDGWELVNVLEGGDCWYVLKLCELLQQAAERVGYPCFLRTGQGSGKHNWDNCCYVDTPESIPNRVRNLVEWSHLVDIAGLPHDTWVVRRLIKREIFFHCRSYGNMPVSREWRYFVDGPQVRYGIPYWPEDALKQGDPDVSNWRQFVPALHSPPDLEIERMVSEAGKAVGGLWSVDVLESEGIWYVTDMAPAERSYGWAPAERSYGWAPAERSYGWDPARTD